MNSVNAFPQCIFLFDEKYNTHLVIRQFDGSKLYRNYIILLCKTFFIIIIFQIINRQTQDIKNYTKYINILFYYIFTQKIFLNAGIL